MHHMDVASSSGPLTLCPQWRDPEGIDMESLSDFLNVCQMMERCYDTFGLSMVLIM